MPTYTTPVDTVTDELVTAARFNAQVMENIRFLYAPPVCSVKRAAAKSIGSGGASTIIDFDQENYDTDSMHSTVTNNNRITIVTAGKYLINAHVSWGVQTGGRRSLSLRLDGASIQSDEATPSSTGYAANHATVGYTIGVGSYIDIDVFQDSGSSVNATPTLEVLWVSG